MSYSLDTPAATTTIIGRLGSSTASWDLALSGTETEPQLVCNSTWSTYEFTYTTITDISSSMSLGINTYTGEYGEFTVLTGATVSYTGCFVVVEPSVFTTIDESEFTSSASTAGRDFSSSTSSGSTSEGSYWTGDYGYVTVGSYSTAWTHTSFTQLNFDGDWSPPGLGLFRFLCSTTWLDTPLFKVGSSCGGVLNPQYDISSVRPNLLSPVSYPEFWEVRQSSAYDPFDSSSFTYSSGSLSQVNDASFVLEHTEAGVSTVNSSVEQYQVTHTIESSSKFPDWRALFYTEGNSYEIGNDPDGNILMSYETYSAYGAAGYAGTTLPGGQEYSFTFEMGFYGWTLNSHDGNSSTGSASYSSTILDHGSTTSASWTYQVGSYSYYTTTANQGSPPIVISPVRVNYPITSFSTASASGISYPERGEISDASTTISASYSWVQYSDPSTSSSSASASGYYGNGFLSDYASAGKSETVLSVPSGCVLVMRAQTYFLNTGTHERLFEAFPKPLY